MERRVKGTKLIFRNSHRGGLEYSDDNGSNWYLTFRSWREVEEMHANLEPAPIAIDHESEEREAFGETMDEPLPDDFYDYIQQFNTTNPAN